jgi:hypothetical protein
MVKMTGKRRRTAEAFQNLDSLERDALQLGIEVVTTSRRGSNLHVMFNVDGRRVLNYWPSTGTTETFDRVYDKVEHADVLELARRTMLRMVHSAVPTT